MVFNSIKFLVFICIFFPIYWLIPKKFRWIWILIGSYYFYMSWNVKYVVLILFTTVVSYFTAILIEKSQNKRNKKALLATAVVLCLGVLFAFKYLNFFFEIINNALSLFTIQPIGIVWNVLLPVGISFYTFQTIAYMVDIYRGNTPAEKNFGVYAAFVSFFPQLVAGPIERSKDLLPQIREPNSFSLFQVESGARLMLWGLFKKMVIADNLAIYVNNVYNDVFAQRGFALVLATLFFAIQIYCDFSGYSDIAVGVSKTLGIDLTENFKAPYFARSIKEFWGRWHISLSTWFKDYLYIPLGGNRRSKFRTYFNLLIVFCVSGLWHGARITFIIWGAIHGVAQILERMIGNIVKKRTKEFLQNKHLSRLLIGLRTIFVFLLINVAWIFFRANSLPEALYVFCHMFDNIRNPIAYLREGFVAAGVELGTLILIVLLFFTPLIAYDFCYYKTGVRTTEWVAKKPLVLRWTMYITIAMLIVIFSQKGVASEFVYFQF